MTENNYECPKCHNIFPLANKFLHDNRCTESNPLPLNASRMVGINDQKKDNRQPMQHRPQPKITAKRKPDSHINPLNIKESIVPIPETFSCWLCGNTLPECEREDHMLSHKLQEEANQQGPRQNQKRPPQNQQRPPHNQQRPPQNQHRPNQNQQRPPQNQYRPPQNQQRPPQNQQRPPHNQNRPPQNQFRPPQKQKQNNPINKINIKRSFVPFDDIQIFDFNQVNEGLNKYNNPTDTDILTELPETEIGDINKLPPEKRNCLICLNDLQTGDKATMLPCIHMFHSSCVQEWVKVNKYCPTCQFKLTK